MTEREALMLALKAMKRIDEVTPTAMAKLIIPEIEQVLAQPEERYTYGTPLLDAMVGCPPCNNHCNQGSFCPNKETRKTTRDEKITNPAVYTTTQLEKPEAMEAGLKRTQMLRNAMDNEHKYIKHQIMPMPPTRNEILEEVAKRFDVMPFGDTAASFAKYVRDMKT